MRTVSDPDDRTRVWEAEYSRIAREVTALLPTGTVALVEVGCGAGQLTIPLVRRLPGVRVSVVDRFEATYALDRRRLLRRLRSEGLLDRVRVISGDATKFLSRQAAGSLDAVVSSEFLTELTVPGLARFVKSCRRAMRYGGVSVHAYLSPEHRNEGQRLTIEADSDPRWAKHPPAEWFSPPPETARESLIEAGFHDVRLEVKRSRLRFTGLAARAQLESWGVRKAFYRSHEIVLRAHGLELPDWVVLSGTRRR